MWMDSHCHLNAVPLLAQQAQILSACAAQQIFCIVPATRSLDYAALSQLAEQSTHLAFALGIHPYFVVQHDVAQISQLRIDCLQALPTGKLVAIGETGLDGFLKQLDWAQQQAFFQAQLALACELGLPLILHSRQAVDAVLQQLRRYRPVGGIAHAFNGSLQQAEQLIKLGFKLGFGGAMTYPRALHLQKLARELPLESIVLETDAPDMPPIFARDVPNSPLYLPQIAAYLADYRGVSLLDIQQHTTHNVLNVLPQLRKLLA